MDRSTLTRTGIAGAVAGLGLAVGGIAIASADDAPDTSSTSAHPGGPRGERGGYDAAALAKALGLKEATVKKALDAVRDELRPEKPADGTKPTPPTEAERAARQAKFVTALAKELNVSEAKVKTAVAAQEKKLEAAREERRTESRADLVTRLDAAVKAGTLTEADKTSVLKAFDAKVIGDGPGGGGFGGGGRGGPPPAQSAS
ncbi:DNA-binding MarR family transcriptional regulator [Marmoricola sp. OAE513]|uniref:hypothetical protein n=1 Tax=Marmoricola sp. OAE513 TaxID=2817894 RepID=UPI001AE7F19B